MERRGAKVGPQCSEPESLQDRHLLTVKDSELCPLPSVNSLTFNSVDPYNFLITWESPDTNMTGLKGFIVAYHRLDKNDQVKKYKVGPTVRGFRIQTVADNTLYLVCVITRGSSYSDGSGGGQGMYMTSTPPTYIEDDEDDDDDTDEFYVMPLGEWGNSKLVSSPRRQQRDITGGFFGGGGDDDDSGDSDSNAISDRFVFPSFDLGLGGGGDDNATTMGFDDEDYLLFPSSNDTELLVEKPAVVNLGSQSSKCIQIRTPVDPAKLSLIDDKKMSAIIGVSMGLLVFIGIIISILTAKTGEKEDDIVEPVSSAAVSSTKSPKSIVPSLKNSRTNSLSSSGIANRLVEASAETALLTGSSRPPPTISSSKQRLNNGGGGDSSAGMAAAAAAAGGNGNLVRRSHFSRTASQETSGGAVPKKQASFAKQSSTESVSASRVSSSAESASVTIVGGAHRRHTRNNSDGFATDQERVPIRGLPNNVMPPPPHSSSSAAGQQSWHGTPRGDPRNANRNSMGFDSSYSTTLPRRSAEMAARLQSGPLGASGMSLDSGTVPGNHVNKRRSDPCHLEGSTTSIPLIEYHLIDGAGPLRAPNAHNRHSFGSGRAPLPPPVGWKPGGGVSRGGHASHIMGGVGAASQSPPVLRSNTFGEGSNHIGSSSQRLLGNHINNSDDLDTIEYYPEVGGRPGPQGRPMNPGTSPRAPRPFVKYNSFANY